jgi:MGT family glycosyltransferase
MVESYEKKGTKTIYISMGTVNQNREFYHNCLEALGNTEFQVIISMGTNTERYENVPDNIELYESVDQMAVLSIADAFITHCGMNSASEGLYFGVPLILFPQTPEQGAVAKRTEELGAGLRLTSIVKEDILAAIQRATSEPSYKQNAERISESFKQCGGIEEAVAFIEKVGKITH